MSPIRLALCLAVVSAAVSAHATLAAPPTPLLAAPADGARLETFSPTLSWSLPAGTTQVHLRIVPFNNDGPGIDLVLGATESFNIPGLPVCACLLPDMGYTWEVRASDAQQTVELDDLSWSPAASRRFRTPVATSAGLSPVQPAPGATVASATPTVQWSDNDPNVFYYEVQISKDATFGGAGPRAAIYGALIHGLLSSPPDSYTVPASVPLEADTVYFWRVRPRTQGDGMPVVWSPSWSFTHRIECCTVTAWIERNMFAPEAASYKAVGKIVDGVGQAVVAAPMEAVFRQQFESTRCTGGLSDSQGIAACVPSPFEPPPNFVVNLPVTVEVRFTHQNKAYSGTTSFTPSRPWNR